MKGYGTVRRKLPFASVLVRFLLAAFLVFATFNPSYYSISTWLISGTSVLSIRAFVGFALLLTWIIVLRISLAGLGWLGLAYVGVTFLIGALFEIQFEFIHLVPEYALILASELTFASILTFGLVFSYWIRQVSGQSPIVKMPP
jgi:hypothetical protein